jgi:polyhydroxybutyrate depolymerase
MALCPQNGVRNHSMNKSCAPSGLLLCIALGCAPTEPDQGGTGGAAGASDASVAVLDSSAGPDAAAATDAAVASGGDAMVNGDTGGSGGGNSTADASGANPGDAGAAASDASRGEAGADPASPAVPSAGCGKGGRPANGVVSATDRIFNFPSDYDGDKPFPLVMALHANGNPNTQLQGLTNGTRLATSFIRVFPKSAGAGWVMSTDAPRVTAIYNDVIANYCVDTSRVFLTGHSSGAQMAVQMLCAPAGEKRFKAVAPVAASKYCAKIAPIPVMYIQGMMDMMRGDSNGIDVVNFFASSNACSSMTLPDGDVAGCNSSFDRAPVTPGCVTYQGCSQPTIWCSHNDNGYNASDGNQHGWPCFASNAMADFFMGLP